ncbi:LOW QUALITY PROTEIN: hypothetical protein V1477_001387 [Vespula maculifrons]|uniref:Uncharacterized protein n=1 Tax=Vespula maculifrons TaxID=7453 RepID=A0ABD2CZ40_VESMC
MKHTYIGTSCFSLHQTIFPIWIRQISDLLCLNGKSISAVFYHGDESISIDEWVIRSLTLSNFKELCVTCYSSFNMVKTAEEADAACEFITNLANNLKPKLVREEANYLVYERNMLLLLEQYYNNHRLQYSI